MLGKNLRDREESDDEEYDGENHFEGVGIDYIESALEIALEEHLNKTYLVI